MTIKVLALTDALGNLVRFVLLLVNRHSKGTPDRRPKGTLLRVGF